MFCVTLVTVVTDLGGRIYQCNLFRSSSSFTIVKNLPYLELYNMHFKVIWTNDIFFAQKVLKADVFTPKVHHFGHY